jgi:acetamidase/formamidase
MNPETPGIYGTIKLHMSKEQKPIRPIVSWGVIPGYKLTKYITTQNIRRLQLPSNYNIKNFLSFIHNLKNIEVNKNTKLCSFNIENKCTNIQFVQVKTVIKEILNNDNHTVEEEEEEELVTLLNSIVVTSFTNKTKT